MDPLKRLRESEDARIFEVVGFEYLAVSNEVVTRRGALGSSMMPGRGVVESFSVMPI